jgi:hypothetical protein
MQAIDSISKNINVAFPQGQAQPEDQDLLEIILDLKAEVSQLKEIIAFQSRELESLRSEERLDRYDIHDLWEAIEGNKTQPLQKDRREVLRSILVAHNGKILAIAARNLMHISESRFSELIKKCDFIETKPSHTDGRKNILILKSKLVPRK